MFYKKAVLALGAVSGVLAQRPSDTSICDYYTTALLKDDTAANQYALLTILVNTVVIGNYSPCAVGGSVPGILAPANYGGEQVNLLPYFNGCLKSTNVNNNPSSVNFLDGGGAAPLMQNMPANSANSNQYGLLTHLYQFFGKLLGCSGYGQMGFPSYMGDPSMARVHKFMALDPNEVGYFISQVGAAATCFGVTASDVSAVAGVLMQYFGYKCEPYMDIGIGGKQLESICEACNCPLAPNANCGLYDNGGCYPQPQVAPQCMSSMSGYGGGYSSSSYYETTTKNEYKTTESKKNEYTTTESKKNEYTTTSYKKPTTTSSYYEKTTSSKKPTTTSSYYKETTSSNKDKYSTTSEYYYPSSTTSSKKNEYSSSKTTSSSKDKYTSSSKTTSSSKDKYTSSTTKSEKSTTKSEPKSSSTTKSEDKYTTTSEY